MSNFFNDGPMTQVLNDQAREHARLFRQMVQECSVAYDMFDIVEILTFLALQGVTFDQVYHALMSLQPKAA